jgi:hypothetical protein
MDHDDEALRFFNGLSGRLKIELSEPPQPVAPQLLNLVAPPTSRLQSVSLVMRVLEGGDFRELTDSEWKRVVLRSPVIRMRGEDEEHMVEHRAADGVAFTVRDLAAAVAETERQTRGHTEWFGGIDVHHVFFEGITLEDDGVWCTSWGS